MVDISKLLSNGVNNAANNPVIGASRVRSSSSVFAKASVEKDLANAGMSAKNSSSVLSAVNGTSTGKGYTYNGVSGTYKPGDTVISSDGVRSTVQPDGTLQGEDIIVTGGAAGSNVDSRLRISALSGKETAIYGPKNSEENIMAPLHATRGMLFPYTPAIQISGESSWTAHDLVQTNFDILSYQRTPSASIGVTGKFTVQNQREGEYAIAVIHFLRTITKMHYGDQESAQNNALNNKDGVALAGLPPPVVRLRGYGKYMFPDLRCVVKGYSFNFDENMDLIRIKSPTGGHMSVPPMFTIQVNLGLQQSPRRVRKDFNLEEFRTGKAFITGGNWF